MAMRTRLFNYAIKQLKKQFCCNQKYLQKQQTESAVTFYACCLLLNKII